MPFWGSEKLRNKQGELVTPSNADLVTQGSIELRMGKEAFVTGRGGERIVLKNDGDDFVIPPGQFGQLLTLERVRVPKDALAFISIKFRHKLRGLVNVSGFHVDPGYDGWLVLSVYNAGAKNIRLSKGERTFLIWYADLDVPMTDADAYTGTRGQSERIPDDYIMQIDGDIASPGSLKTGLTELDNKVKHDIEKLRSEITLNRTLIGILTALLIGAFLVPTVRSLFDGQQPSGQQESEAAKSESATKSEEPPQDSLDATTDGS